MKNFHIKISITIVLFLIIGVNIIQANAGFLNKNTKLLIQEQGNSIDDQLFDFKIKLLMKLGHMPSLSICFIKEDSVVRKNSYGQYNLETNSKATNDTIYMIASVTKTFIATAILQLYEDKIIDLDENVSKWLPFDLKNPKYPEINITFRMLLAHQSSRFDTINGPADKNYNRIEMAFFINKEFKYVTNPPTDRHEWLMDYISPNGCKYDSNLWGDYPPGKYYNYSNDGYIILGYLLEKITGQTLEEYCQQNIFEPLGMKDTSFHPTDLDNKRLAVPYFYFLGKYISLPIYDQGALNPCGGLRTTIDDLSKYLIAHMNNGTYGNVRILENDTVSLMHTIQPPNDYYCLGWIVQDSSLGDIVEGHSGGIFGYQAQMWTLRENKVGVIAFYNQLTFRPLLYKSAMSPIELFAYRNLVNLLLKTGLDI